MANCILLVNARFLSQNISGVQRFGIEISKIIRKEYPDAIFLSPSMVIDSQLKEELGALCVGRASGHFWEQVELPLFIKRNYKNYLLLNFCNTGPYLIKNQYVTIHDVSYFVNKKWFSYSFATLYRTLVPLLAKRSKGIFTVSNFSKNEILKYIDGIDPAKIHVVYNSAASIFKRSIKEKKGNYILSVASLDPRKNLSTLIEAFNKIKDQIPDIKLILVGGGHQAFPDEMQKLVKSASERIEFTGYVSDEKLAQLYENARLFVYISLYEGFGIPAIEALSSGCPILLSRIECHQEICKETAEYCNPNDSQDIATKMAALVKTPISVDSLMDLQKYASIYSWDNSAMKIMRILNGNKITFH